MGERLFALLEEQLRAKGLIVRRGSLIDATLIKAQPHQPGVGGDGQTRLRVREGQFLIKRVRGDVQHLVSQGGLSLPPGTAAVNPPVGQGIHHLLENFWDHRFPIQIDYAADAAHGPLSPLRPDHDACLVVFRMQAKEVTLTNCQ